MRDPGPLAAPLVDAGANWPVVSVVLGVLLLGVAGFGTWVEYRRDSDRRRESAAAREGARHL